MKRKHLKLVLLSFMSFSSVSPIIPEPGSILNDYHHTSKYVPYGIHCIEKLPVGHYCWDIFLLMLTIIHLPITVIAPEPLFPNIFLLIPLHSWLQMQDSAVFFV